MLYVPPGVGHRGVTLPDNAEIALTYSVGFRAPSIADLLSTLLSRALSSDAPRLFSDPGRQASKDAGEMASEDLTSLRQFLVSDLESFDPDGWALAMGEAVTSGGSSGVSAVRATPRSVRRRLGDGATVSVVPGARMSWTALGRGRAALFVNGESRVLPRSHAFAAGFLCGNSSRSSARRVATQVPLLLLTVELFRAGVIDWSR
jgi:50S ribosomal protein L16 3-hydroxylase